jgi:hypothetical protein
MKEHKRKIGRPEAPDELKAKPRSSPRLTDDEMLILEREFGKNATISKAIKFLIKHLIDKNLKMTGIVEASKDEKTELAITEAASHLKEFIRLNKEFGDIDVKEIAQQAFKK